MKTLVPVAVFRSPFGSKFGVPRQSGLAPDLPGRVEFEPPFRDPAAWRGIADFDYVWLVWGFHGVEPVPGAPFRPTVRPPRLGGNARVGVFATRSPFRPNGLGLSAVRLVGADATGLDVAGADLADGTPVYDVKPYLPWADARPDARAGFAGEPPAPRLEVRLPDALAAAFPPAERAALLQALALDPRPAWQDDPERVYGFPFAGREVRFRVAGGVLSVLSADPAAAAADGAGGA